MSGKLPDPDRLTNALRHHIGQSGPIGFDVFMAAALYDPLDGYYASGRGQPGKRGDFFTSVSVGPVFGRLLAAQFAEIWRYLGCPKDFTLVEQGAADGQLLADILDALERDQPDCQPQAVIIEPSPLLQVAQQKTLAPWLDRLTQVKDEKFLDSFTGVFFANELLDAFPVQLLVRNRGIWSERRVGWAEGKFAFTECPLEESTLPVTAHWPIPAAVPRFCTEWCPSLAPWLQNIANKLKGGAIFLVDYGHPAAGRFHPARADGTLASYRNHQRTDDPLSQPGLQDLTAHLDFSALARTGEELGLTLAGFTDQHHALTGLAAQLFPPMPKQAISSAEEREMRALRQLLHPETMGTSFKFLALTRKIDQDLTAFAFASNPREALFSQASTYHPSP